MISNKSDLSKSKVELKDNIEINNRKYIVDGIKVVLDPNKKEIQTALWLSKKLNKRVEMLPRILMPENIKTSDYLINGEHWDLKTIISNRSDAIRNRIKNQESQASNFIIDISKSKITLKSAEKQINDLYALKGYKWVKTIIIKNNNVIKIIHKKS